MSHPVFDSYDKLERELAEAKAQHARDFAAVNTSVDELIAALKDIRAELDKAEAKLALALQALRATGECYGPVVQGFVEAAIKEIKALGGGE